MKVQHPALTFVVVLLLCLQTSALALDDVGNVVQVPQVTSEALAETTEDTSLQVAAEAEETQSLSIGSGVIFVAGVAMLGIIGYVVYRQHRRNVAKEHDNQLMQSLLDSEMDYAAM
ncbi:hypothetical protein H257_12585 [Aphanomyces astaci]|uniref:Uncharacterized protein n=1 Tax=Aphanomyces astaci TaxID=112090 RepID=W4FZN0_APHAT|nr:hypothetical protein H257_12585 [Aphanomyces astaci]ETV72471.1 hypothetical protein H257_12585 [Aphanomyces astaci]|eukprot:XP_009838153.1 hypothetical protein H257_12585 [Aphanomyces astaci]